jgi:hypothetical protein
MGNMTANRGTQTDLFVNICVFLAETQPRKRVHVATSDECMDYETWVCQYKPSFQQQSMEWKHLKFLKKKIQISDLCR